MVEWKLVEHLWGFEAKSTSQNNHPSEKQHLNDIQRHSRGSASALTDGKLVTSPPQRMSMQQVKGTADGRGAQIRSASHSPPVVPLQTQAAHPSLLPTCRAGLGLRALDGDFTHVFPFAFVYFVWAGGFTEQRLNETRL